MARLSNFLRRHDDDSDGTPDDPVRASPVCRPARNDELDAALRLMLAGPGGLATQEQVLEYVAFTNQRGVDVRQMWVAVREAPGSGSGRVEWRFCPW